jgi:TolB-like protein
MERPFPAYKGDAPYIFVSYSHNDAATVYPELAQLKDAGFNIWYDEGISPGSTWRDEVALALTQSKVFLYYISPNSIRSENCLQELNFALSRERKVLAVHLEPTELTMGVELSLSNKQAIIKADLTETAYFDKLNNALSALMPRPVHLEPVFEMPTTAATSASPDERSIAILPFNNRSSDEEIEYLCDGIAEELIGGLSKLDGLRVASQLSTFGLKNQGFDIRTIGDRLKVSHVLSGSVQKSGERVRVSISLNEVARDNTVWSERYNGTLEDVFDFQESVARNVVAALELKLSGERQAAPLIDAGTRNAQAYNAFLLGHHAFMTMTARSLTVAIDHLTNAVALDPQFGRAYWYLHLCNRLLHQEFGAPGEVLLARAREAAEKAWRTDFLVPFPKVEIERNLTGVYPTDTELALEAIDKVRNADPEWQGYQYWQLGRQLGIAGLHQGALDYLTRYRDTTPVSQAANTNFTNYYCSALEMLGRFEEEIEFITQEIAANPDRPLQLGVRAMTYSRTGQYRKAEEDLRTLTRIFPRNFAQFYHLYWTREMDAAHEYYAWLEKQPKLQALFKYWGAFLLGELDKGLDYLSETNNDSWGIAVGSIRCLPQSRAQEVRNHPRHRAMMEALGITDAWRSELLERVNELAPVTGITVKPDEEY